MDSVPTELLSSTYWICKIGTPENSDVCLKKKKCPFSNKSILLTINLLGSVRNQDFLVWALLCFNTVLAVFHYLGNFSVLVFEVRGIFLLIVWPDES